MNASFLKPFLFFLFLNTPCLLFSQSTLQNNLSDKINNWDSFDDPDTLFVNRYQSFERIEGKYVLKTYNPDLATLTHYASYDDKKRSILNGDYREWYDNKNKWKEGQYDNNKTIGIWKFYDYENNHIKYGTYKNNKKEGIWYAVDSSDHVQEEKEYKNGLLDGELIRYDAEGEILFKILYQNNEIVDKAIFDTLQYQDYKNNTHVTPTFKTCENLKGKSRIQCTSKEYLNYVYSNIEYPEQARYKNIEGEAILSFVIEKDGTIKDIITYRGVCKEIEAECLRVLKGIPTWIPGEIDGQPVNITMNLPVRFKLD